MATEIQAKKGRGIEEVIEGLTPQGLEETKEAVVSGSTSKVISSVLQLYHSYLQDVRELNTQAFFNPDLKTETKDVDILTPAEINAFLQLSIMYEDHPDQDLCLGNFLGKLIRRSYLAGFNDFFLQCESSNLVHYLDQLKGCEKNPIRIAVYGDLGSGNFDLSRQVDTVLYGNCESAPGREAEDCTFYIKEEVLGRLPGMVFWPFQGTLWWDDKAERTHCTFKTNNPNLAAAMQNTVPPGNRIIFVKNDGTKTILRDYK